MVNIVKRGGWRTYSHPRALSSSSKSSSAKQANAEGSYGVCQIIDRRTQVIHLVPLERYQLHQARLKNANVTSDDITRYLWPTAVSKLTGLFAEQLLIYLWSVRDGDLPQPSSEGVMISMSVYPDSSLSWPAVTAITRDTRRPEPSNHRLVGV